jgi:hypothetical protein
MRRRTSCSRQWRRQPKVGASRTYLGTGPPAALQLPRPDLLPLAPPARYLQQARAGRCARRRTWPHAAAGQSQSVVAGRLMHLQHGYCHTPWRINLAGRPKVACPSNAGSHRRFHDPQALLRAPMPGWASMQGPEPSRNARAFWSSHEEQSDASVARRATGRATQRARLASKMAVC